MESPRKMEGLRYPFLVRHHHSIIYKNSDEIHAKQYQIMKNPTSSRSSPSSSPPLIFQQNIEIPKSFDDVWSDVDHVDAMKTYRLPPRETNTNADITLEEFLIRAGAINPTEDQEGFVDNPVPLMMMANGDDPMLISSCQKERDVNVPMLVQDVVGSNFRRSEDYFEEKMMDLDLKMPVPIINEMGVGRGDNFLDLLQDESDRRRWVCKDDMMRKSIERRQRRMIKNRESAARSRAKKQAHTNQLLQSVQILKATNILLKKRKEAEKLLNSRPTSAPRYQLRRTSSEASEISSLQFRKPK